MKLVMHAGLPGLLLTSVSAVYPYWLKPWAGTRTDLFPVAVSHVNQGIGIDRQVAPNAVMRHVEAQPAEIKRRSRELNPQLPTLVVRRVKHIRDDYRPVGGRLPSQNAFCGPP